MAQLAPLTREDVERSLPHRFEQVVTAHGHRLAVGLPQRNVTYAELDAMANRVAHAILAERGDVAEPVALLLEQGLSQIVGLLGVLKAGKFYVVLEPTHPRARNEYILADAGPAVLIAETATREIARDLAPDRMCVLDIDALGATEASSSPSLTLGPDRPAYILYTSGSTGQPKGVLATHRAVLHEMVRVTDLFHVCPEDRQTLLRSCGFSGAQRDVHGSLLNGASVHPLNLDAEGLTRLATWLHEQEITTFRAVVSVFRALMATARDTERFPDVRLVHTGGEAVNTSDVRLFARRFPHDAVFASGLGITEAGTVAHYVPDPTLAGVSDGLLPVGYPTAGVELLLLDERGEPVGPGAIGEIAVRSRYLASGYWRRPELTAARFLPDPHGGDARIYLTGDLGLRRPDGCVEYHGRQDFQVKVRGVRVEVGEVEAALLSLGDLREAVVVAREDAPGECRLVGYVVAAEPPGPTPAVLRRALADRLPALMVPSTFVRLSAMPLSAVGKVDRGALPPPPRVRPLDSPPVPPSTPIETTLAAIWADILELDEIGVHDAFLDLGGDSIRAVRIASRARSVFHVDVPMSELFTAATVSAMAAVVAAALASDMDATTVARILGTADAPDEGRR